MCETAFAAKISIAKPIAFSIFILCKEIGEPRAAAKLNASFC